MTDLDVARLVRELDRDATVRPRSDGGWTLSRAGASVGIAANSHDGALRRHIADAVIAIRMILVSRSLEGRADTAREVPVLTIAGAESPSPDRTEPIVTLASYNVVPVSKPRQTRSDQWKRRPAVLRYRRFADDCRGLGMTVESGDRITFQIPMPPSWSKRKRASMEGQAHQGVPDLDNLVKAVLDACHADDDSHVWKLSLEKRWAEAGMILIERSAHVARV